MTDTGIETADRPVRRIGALHQIVIEVVLVALFAWWANWPGLGWVVAAYLPLRWLLLAGHEYGHVIGAGLGGRTVRLVSIGTGPSKVVKLGTVEVRLGLWPDSGFMLAFPTGAPEWRRSKLLSVAGGPTFNLVALVVLLIWRPGTIGWVAVVINAAMLVSSLTLVEVSVPGLGNRVPTDGLAIARLLFLPTEDQERRENMTAAVYVPGASPGEKLTAATELLRTPGLDAATLLYLKGLVAYYIAVFGLVDRYDEADRLSADVVAMDQSDASVDTRGCVLAVMGGGLEAVPMLERGLVGIKEMGLGDEELGWCHSFLAKAHLDGGAEPEARSHALIAAELGATIPAFEEVQKRLGLANS